MEATPRAISLNRRKKFSPGIACEDSRVIPARFRVPLLWCSHCIAYPLRLGKPSNHAPSRWFYDQTMTEKRGKNMPRPRGTGSIYLQKGSAMWWVKYYRNGKAYRESTHKTNEKEAQDFLKQRLAEITTGNFVGPRTE